MLLSKPFQPSPSRRFVSSALFEGQRLRNVVRCCPFPVERLMPGSKAQHISSPISISQETYIRIYITPVQEPVVWDALAISPAAKALLQQHGVKASTSLEMHRVLGFEDVDDIQHLTSDHISQLELKPLQLEPLLKMLREHQGRQTEHLKPPGPQLQIKPPVELSGISYMAFSGDGRRALSCIVDNEQQLLVWDRTTGARIATLEGPDGSIPTCVAMTPDGRKAVSGSRDSTVLVWNLDTHTYITSLEGHTAEVGCVAISPDGRRAVSGGEDGALRLWDLDTCVCIASLGEHIGPVLSVAITPDGRRALSCDECKLRLWDLDSHTCTAMEGHGEGLYAVAVTPDGRHAVSGGADKALRIWDLETHACTSTLQGHTGTVNCVAVAPDGRHAVSSSDDATLRVWDLATHACAATIKAQKDIWMVVITPDGRYAVSSTADHTSRVWDLAAYFGCASGAGQ